MLLHLHIKNYALIEELRLEFGAGLNLFTGETGAGKSIIIESIGLLLGERAQSQAVRKGADRCFISGEFECARLGELKALLSDGALTGDSDDILIIRREIDAQGRSRAFVNDRPVSLATLQAVGKHLVDVHGQHEHQSLIHAAEQRHLIDRYADADDLLKEVGTAHASWKELVARRQSRQISEQERQRLVDLYTYQSDEIDNAKLIPDEEEEIARLLPTLKNAEKLRELSDEAYQALYGADGAVLEHLTRVQKTLESVVSLSGNLGETLETLKSACSQIDDVAREVEHFHDTLSADPERLNDLLSRQDLIHKLRKKYGSTIPDILAYRDKIAAELTALSNSDHDRQELDKLVERQKDKLFHLCDRLSALRKKAGEKLAAGVEKELGDLGMKKARCRVSVEKEAEPGSEGWDRIEFLFSANPGEDPKPLKQIASGGEMSRVMLALKTVLAKADRVPVLIFDEIDTGIGGPMGQTVGRKLSALSKHHQVLCITHLPQIAAFGASHLHVEKATEQGRTRTNVRQLAGKDRIEEVARMLSGEEITPAARKHASELIESCTKAN